MSTKSMLVCLAASGLVFTAGAMAEDDLVSAQTDTFSERYKTFDQLDLNQDGKLDAGELATYGSNEPDVDARSLKRGERVLDKLDEDDNGTVSRKELQEGAESADTDANWW